MKNCKAEFMSIYTYPPTTPIGNLPSDMSKTPATVNSAVNGSPNPLIKFIS